MSEHLDPKKVQETLVDDVIREGKLENETGSMEASIKPNYDITANYPEQKIADAIKSADDNLITEHIEVGTDASGHQYARVEENVEGQE